MQQQPGEALPPFLYINDSSAKLDDNFHVKVDWWLVARPSNHHHSCLGMVAHLMWTGTAFMLFAPVPTINGTANEIGSDRPCIDTHFTKEKIHIGWFVPFTRSCLKNKRIRKELGQHIEDAGLENLQLLAYGILTDSTTELMDSTQGFWRNYSIGSQFILTEHWRMPNRWRNCSEVEKEAFSVSGQWNFCNSCIVKSRVTLLGQQQQLQIARWRCDAQGISRQSTDSAALKLLRHHLPRMIWAMWSGGYCLRQRWTFFSSWLSRSTKNKWWQSLHHCLKSGQLIFFLTERRSLPYQQH